MEERLNQKLQELFEYSQNGDQASFFKFILSAELIKVNSCSKIQEIVQELELFFKNHPFNNTIESILSRNKNVSEIKINDSLITIKPTNVLAFFPRIFKNNELLFIKFALLFGEETSQKLILINTIEDFQNEMV